MKQKEHWLQRVHQKKETKSLLMAVKYNNYKQILIKINKPKNRKCRMCESKMDVNHNTKFAQNTKYASVMSIFVLFH